MQIQLFRERLSEQFARDNPERQYRIRSIQCSWHCSVKSTFVAFLQFSTRKHTFMGFCANIVVFVRKTVNSKPPTIPLGIVACTFSDNLSRNSCMRKSHPQQLLRGVDFYFSLLLASIYLFSFSFLLFQAFSLLFNEAYSNS